MRKILVVLTALSCLFLGDSSDAKQYTIDMKLKSNYRVVVLSSTPDMHLLAMQSAWSWQEATKLPNLFVFSLDTLGADILILSVADLGPDKLGVAYPSITGGPCIIQINERTGFNVKTLMHEIGHCIGLDHDENPKSLMHAYASPDQELTEETIQTVKEARNVN